MSGSSQLRMHCPVREPRQCPLRTRHAARTAVAAASREQLQLLDSACNAPLHFTHLQRQDIGWIINMFSIASVPAQRPHVHGGTRLGVCLQL